MDISLKSLTAKVRVVLTTRFALLFLGMAIGSAITIAAIYFPTNLLKQYFIDSDSLHPTRYEFKLPPISLPDNPRIQHRLRYYLQPGSRADLLLSYKRAGKYLPMITAILEEYNLPEHFVFLPILESRYLPHTRSRSGAVGLWQLMPATAAEYGLKNNRWIDERRDPEKSTVVAAEFLKHLYERFGNWDLVLAAYNCGPAKLRRAIRREKTSDFWKLRKIPGETYNFVANFYAILHLLTNNEKHGVTLPSLSKPMNYETIDIEATFSVEQIARLANVSTAVIKRYNPALLGNLAPSGVYPIRVPTDVKEQFLQQYEKNPLDRVEITYITHRVRQGDTLLKIANRYGTTVREIMADNNLRSSRWIKAGIKLRIASVTITKAPSPDRTLAEVTAEDSVAESTKLKFVYRVKRDGLSLKTVSRYYSVASEEIKKWNPWLQSDRLRAGEELTILKVIEDIVVHKTRRGDSLWKLARRYNTTVGNLKRWNQLTSSRIYPGKNLVVGLER